MKKILIGLLVIAFAAGAYFFLASDRVGDSFTSHEDEYLIASDRFIDVAGAKVRIREEGGADAPPVILMHGFLYSLETFDEWAHELSRDYRVIRFDLLGHGLTGPDLLRRYAPEERAAFVGDVMDALGIERAIIGGNSLGGLAAWRFAATNPDRVVALILAAPGGYSINGVENAPVAPPEALKLFLRTAPEAGVRLTLANLFADDSLVTPDRVARLRDMMRREGNGDAFVQSIEEFVLPDPEADLAKIVAPTLILWGSKDALIPPEHGARFEAAIPGAMRIVYDNVGHLPQEEAGAQSAADVAAFLASVEGLPR